MRLLLDANLSHRLLAMVLKDFPQSVHVRDIGLMRASDDEIWRYRNTSTDAIIEIFRRQTATIHDFLSDSEVACLVLKAPVY